MPKKSSSILLANWLPAIVWMIVIFFFSARPRFVFSEDDLINFLFFKSLHVIEYTILTLLYYFALSQKINHWSIREYFSKFAQMKLNFATIQKAALLTIIYAISDEYHQTLVPGRFGTLRDVGIDAIGILLSIKILSQGLHTKLFGKS